MKKLYLFITLSFLFLGLNTGQVKEDDKTNENSLKELFLEAESYFLYEEYTEALPLYLKINKQQPNNDNINFKIGVCYLNIPYEKEKSIEYLEKAVKNIHPYAKPTSLKETMAPPDAMYYLGNAYRINNQLDKALTTYNKFKDKLDPTVYDDNLVNDQIVSIKNAKKLAKKPVYFEKTNLGDVINSKSTEFNAVVSSDETVLVYNVKLQFYDALFYTTKVNGRWSPPINIIPDLGVDGDVYATSISADGKELYIYRSDNFDGNLYVSVFKNGRWNPVVKLNENINTKYWESHACIAADGKTLYFTSNRKGGNGGLDIYKATRTNFDDWGNVTNLGPEINSPFNEETPFITDDGKTLFFSSYGHFNMGGYDIFYSTLLDDGKWSSPLNLGYPINSTDDDVFFVPVL
jgi:tetratricopeptide (TPR) repeat protein